MFNITYVVAGFARSQGYCPHFLKPHLITDTIRSRIEMQIQQEIQKLNRVLF